MLENLIITLRPIGRPCSVTDGTYFSFHGLQLAEVDIQVRLSITHLKYHYFTIKSK